VCSVAAWEQKHDTPSQPICRPAWRLLCPGVFAQTALPVRVRGTIDSVDAQTMTVTSRDGRKIALAIAPDVVVTAMIAASITDIKPGSYIGTAAMPQADGTLRAFEIQVFPDSMRGVEEGHHPWDLQR
jgi:hypothetical protein